ncbi:MAG: very short patch repair endonuclease [Phycisphaerae bacterium]|nr:very short patch repair endonuclease [Phycisphaerae bacterium]
MDPLSARQRSRLMSRITGRNTGPELIVRRLAHALGYRYRLHVRSVPGCPDLVFKGRRKAIFVHGCFWHRHSCRKGRSMPSSHRAFWKAKLGRNRARDTRTRRTLRRSGWGVFVIWECQLTDLKGVERGLIAFLGPTHSKP